MLIIISLLVTICAFYMGVGYGRKQRLTQIEVANAEARYWQSQYEAAIALHSHFVAMTAEMAEEPK